MQLSKLILRLQQQTPFFMRKSHVFSFSIMRTNTLRFMMILIVILFWPISPLNAASPAQGSYICTVYTLEGFDVDDAYRSRLIEGTEYLSKGLFKEAIAALKEVITSTDNFDLEYIARNNLVCAYLKEASLSTTNLESCNTYVVESMRERKELLTLEMDLDVLPNIQSCDSFALSINASELPTLVAFSLSNGLTRAMIDDVNYFRYIMTDKKFSPLIIELVSGKNEERRLPRHGVYCYKIPLVDGKPLEEEGIANIPFGEEETYILKKFDLPTLGTVWRLQETKDVSELIIVIRLNDSETHKAITITASDGKKFTRELDINSNRIDTIEIETDGKNDLQLDIKTETTTSSSNVPQTVTGENTLHAVDIGQLYDLDDSEGRTELWPAICDDYIKANLGQKPFGAQLIGYGDSRTGIISSRSGDKWVFEGKADEVIEVTMRSDDLNPILEIRDSSGKTVASNIAAGDTSIPNARIIYSLPHDDTYSIITRSGDSFIENAQVDTGSYNVTLERISQIQYGDQFSGEVNDDNGDSWEFSGNASNVIDISSLFEWERDNPLVPSIDIINSSQKTIAADIGYSNFLTLPETDRYTIRVKGYKGDTGAYTFKLKLLSSQTILHYEPEYGEITGDSDAYWVFWGNAGDSVTINMTGIGSNGNKLDTSLELYDPTGQSISYNDDIIFEEKLDSQIKLSSLPKTGYYIIAASYCYWGEEMGQGTSEGPYSLLVQQ